MTPEERAQALIDSQYSYLSRQQRDFLVRDFADEIRAAMQAAYEDAAKVADRYYPSNMQPAMTNPDYTSGMITGWSIANDIRQRAKEVIN